MDRSETIREKTSLADRFGLRILFQGLDKSAYLELVDKLAAQAQIVLDQEELHRQALAWERFHASRTPRLRPAIHSLPNLSIPTGGSPQFAQKGPWTSTVRGPFLIFQHIPLDGQSRPVLPVRCGDNICRIFHLLGASPIATPNPAARSMEMSLPLSPMAMVRTGSTPSRAQARIIPYSFVAWAWVISTLWPLDQAKATGSAAKAVWSCFLRSSGTQGRVDLVKVQVLPAAQGTQVVCLLAPPARISSRWKRRPSPARRWTCQLSRVR